jgi:hypothetical protein
MYARHCDAESCDSWQRVDTTVFITVHCPGHPEFHFCTLNCLMLWAAANSVPTEAVAND